MRVSVAGALLTMVLVPATGHAQAGGDAGEAIRSHLYAGTLAEGRAEMEGLAAGGDAAAAFGVGLFTFFAGFEALAQAVNRHGFDAAGGLVPPFMGIPQMPAAPAAAPEPLGYEDLRSYLDAFVAAMDESRDLLLAASEDDNFAVDIDTMAIRVDLDGDGMAGERETVGALLTQAIGLGWEMGLEPQPDIVPEAVFAFDAADAIWLAGYSQILALQADFLLAHDFETFFDAALHRFFPGAGLPMDGYAAGGELFMGAESDARIADAIAALHTLNWPVADPERLAGVRARLLEVIALSRRNWAAILAETDDDREFMPGPHQTPVFEQMTITEDMVPAWFETLDAAEAILDGNLLLPHWRFAGLGFDLRRYFETANRTDFVLLLSGYDALPFLAEGEVADAESFAAANAVFGDAIWVYALWFN